MGIIYRQSTTPNAGPDIIKGAKLSFTELDGNLAFLSESIAGVSASQQQQLASTAYLTTGSNATTQSITSSFIMSGSATVVGRLTANNLTGSLFGSASYAATSSFVVSSSYSTTSSYAISASYSKSGSYTVTASYAINGGRPAGSDKNIQFNSNGIFSGSTAFNYVYTSGSLEQGLNAKASGVYSHAQGNITTASGEYSHAEGGNTKATGNYSHAEGDATRAVGNWSHTEGYLTYAVGDYSHAEGREVTASGYASHAEGRATVAAGDYSHAGGTGTIASGSGQTVVGSYNLHQNTGSFFVIGNGLSNGSRSDLLRASGSVVEVTGSVQVTAADNQGLVNANLLRASVAVRSSTYYPLTYTNEWFTIPAGGTTYQFAAFPFISGQFSTGVSSNDTYAILGNLKIGTRYASDISERLPAIYIVRDGTDSSSFPDIQYGDLKTIFRTVISDNYNTPAGGNSTTTAINTATANGRKHVLAVTGSFLSRDGVTLGTNLSNSHYITGSVALTGSLAVSLTEASKDKVVLYDSTSRLLYYTASSAIGGGGGSSTTPGGADQNIQFNANGAFSGSANFKFRYISASVEHGTSNTATGLYSYAQGQNAIATGEGSHAEGNTVEASGNYSHAEGTVTLASGTGAHAEGEGTSAAGANSHAEGQNAVANGDFSHAEGNSTVAGGSNAHAEGAGTVANGYASHAEGGNTKATGDYSHTEGQYTTASGLAAHAEGRYTIAAGAYSHAEGIGSEANVSGSHAEGYYSATFGVYSHAEGISAYAYGNSSHAEGFGTKAYGEASHAEGNDTSAYGNYSHVEGFQTYTDVNAQYSHAEGSGSRTFGEYSHAQGSFTIASGSAQAALGKFNKHGNTTSLVVIGDGADNNTRNDLVQFNPGAVIMSGSFALSGSLSYDIDTSTTPSNTNLFSPDGYIHFNLNGTIVHVPYYI